MFGVKAQRIAELKEEILDLQDKISELKAEKRLKESRAESLCDAFEDLNASSFSFDWKAGQAFSIERIHEWNEYHEFYQPITVIGYFKNAEEGKIGEWKFYCTQEEHQRLVADFEAYRKKAK